jgi:hypothetical protein
MTPVPLPLGLLTRVPRSESPAISTAMEQGRTAAEFDRTHTIRGSTSSVPGLQMPSPSARVDSDLSWPIGKMMTEL